ncbi:hypothetical protein CsatA_001679 [Cannabis sativa]
MFWRPGMKNDVTEYVAKCLTCQRVKDERQRPAVVMFTKSVHFLPVKTNFSIDKYAELYLATIRMVPYELLYGRKCKSPIDWDELRARKFLCPEAVQRTSEAVDKSRV